jgi:isocitrate dehydrogenase
MTKKTVRTFTGDGAFGFVHEVCIKDLLHSTATGIYFVDDDWGLMNRVKTDGQVIHQSIKATIAGGDAVIKYPGATATAEELKYMSDVAGSESPKTALGKGKSPNAVVRGASGLDASIVRPPARSAALIKPAETKWSPQTPVEIHTLEMGGRKANTQILTAPHDGALTITFKGNDGSEERLVGASGDDFNLAKGSPLTLTHVDMAAAEKRIRTTFDDALAKGADVSFANKNTVLTSVDKPILEKAKTIFKAEYQEAFAAKGLSFKDGLVDDAFAYLLASEWRHNKPLIMLCPDDCYGAQMNIVLSKVKQHGLHYDHTKHPIAVARLSNGYGDEYGGIHFTPKTDGQIIVTDTNKNILGSKDVHKDGMVLMASNDITAAKTYANRMIDYAINSRIGGHKTKILYFGFDRNSPSEEPIADAIEQVLNQRKGDLQKAGVSADIRDTAIIAGEVLTHPSEKAILLALNNLWGDIMADLFPALANNKASYDSVLISDKGFMVETGAGGTAGDLLTGKDGSGGMLKHGKMFLNPIAILSGYAHAIRYKGDDAQKKYADQLEEAIDMTLKQGYLTGDLVPAGKHQLRSEFVANEITPKAVDSRVFVQAVKVNLLELQGKTQDAAMERTALNLMSARLDLTLESVPLAPREKDLILQYVTAEPTGHNIPAIKAAIGRCLSPKINAA